VLWKVATAIAPKTLFSPLSYVQAAAVTPRRGGRATVATLESLVAVMPRTSVAPNRCRRKSPLAAGAGIMLSAADILADRGGTLASN
jgi:hypothetical protein